MENYLKLLEYILASGTEKDDRTGTGTKSIFGYQMRFDLQKGFPLVTTKKLHLKSIIYELLWFLKGDTNIAYLNEHGVRIWDEWADARGDLGPIYSQQWRSWTNLVFEKPEAIGVDFDTAITKSRWVNKPIDQISILIHDLKTNPDSRRLIVSAWNVADLPKMHLSPCHCLFQFYTVPPDKSKGEIKRKLSCQLYQRSADVFLGVPFNIASYALLTMMIARVCDMVPNEFIHSFGDVHIYKNHIEQVKLQLSRQPFPLPKMIINPKVKDIFNFEYEDFTLENYQFHPAIKAKVAV